jgi:hypothetical protein
MSQLSPEQHPTASNENEQFSPKSFIIFCLDEDGNVAFEASWGETEEDIRKFAVLLNKINNGTFDKMIVEQLKLQSKESGDSKKYTIFNKIYKELNKPKDLVVDPTNVELN